MLRVKFYDKVDDSLLMYAVIVSKSAGKWVFCKHKERETFELPGGRREPGEAIIETARRELWEETGAKQYEIRPICVYSVSGVNSMRKDPAESFGMLYSAEIYSFEPELHCEIERIVLFEELPGNWTYPDIQPKLVERVAGVLCKPGNL